MTAVGAAREIIRAGQFETRKCPVFSRNLVYFFALRPAYKLKGSDQKQSVVDFFPFVFVVSPENLGAPYHVYPFDTGGAHSGAFDEGASPWFYLDDYELEVNLQAASDHIAWAFGDRANYYDGTLIAGFVNEFPDWDVGPITFGKIAALASVGSNRPDKRASAIEIAFDHHVNLKEVKLAILPRQFLEDPDGNNTEIIDKLTATGVPWDTYEWTPNRAPADFQNEINKMVRAHLISQGQL